MKKQRNSVESVVAMESNQSLVKVVNQSGVDLSEGKMYAMHFAENMKLITSLTEEAAESINWDNPSADDVKTARKIRLSLVPNRTDAERKKDMLKKSLLTKTNLIQGLYNVVKSSSELIEEKLMEMEKRKEREEKQILDELKAARVALLEPYTDAQFPVEYMTEDAFSALLNAQKSAHEARIQAEKEAEERALAEAQEAQRVRDIERKLLPMSSWIDGYNDIVLSALSEEQTDAILAIAKQTKAIEEAAAAEALAQAEAMREEQERIRKELAEAKALQEAERKARLDAEQRARFEQEMREAEEAARLKAEQETAAKAAAAPDLEKVKRYAQEIFSLEAPLVSSPEAKEIVDKIYRLKEKILLWTVEEIKKLK